MNAREHRSKTLGLESPSPHREDDPGRSRRPHPQRTLHKDRKGGDLFLFTHLTVDVFGALAVFIFIIYHTRLFIQEEISRSRHDSRLRGPSTSRVVATRAGSQLPADPSVGLWRAASCPRAARAGQRGAPLSQLPSTGSYSMRTLGADASAAPCVRVFSFARIVSSCRTSSTGWGIRPVASLECSFWPL